MMDWEKYNGIIMSDKVFLYQEVFSDDKKNIHKIQKNVMNFVFLI
jgi:IS1 family transposase